MMARLAPTSAGAVCALALLTGGCGRIHESSIAKGFSFLDSGGNDKKIIFHEGGSPATVVVDARVDSYTRDSIKIIAARRPLKSRGTGADALSSECEYWIIDTNTRVAHRIPDASAWPEVHCGRS
jgi:hypothetical protein